MRVRRLLVGGGMVVASLAFQAVTVPAVVGAAPADTGCYNSCPPPNNPHTTDPNSLPFTSSGAPASNSPTSSLPFTGADIGEIGALGAGAVLVGGLLAHRRRKSIA